jgi:hypothetical protein
MSGLVVVEQALLMTMMRQQVMEDERSEPNSADGT